MVSDLVKEEMNLSSNCLRVCLRRDYDEGAFFAKSGNQFFQNRFPTYLNKQNFNEYYSVFDVWSKKSYLHSAEQKALLFFCSQFQFIKFHLVNSFQDISSISEMGVAFSTASGYTHNEYFKKRRNYLLCYNPIYFTIMSHINDK